jgi:hypothetical protein
MSAGHQTEVRNWRDSVLAGLGPLVLLTAVLVAVILLLATGQGAAIYQALFAGLSDPQKLPVALGFLIVTLLVSLTIFLIPRQISVLDQIKALAASVQNLQESDLAQNDATENIKRECADLKRDNASLHAKLVSGGHQEDEAKDLWKPVANSYFAQFCCKNQREARESYRPGGVVEFEVTDWAIENWLPRIAVGTALADWRVIHHIPRVAGPFEANALLPVRKFLFILDHLAEVCKRQGRAYTFDNIRVAIVRDVEPKYRSLSISVLRRQTIGGAEDIVITYQRQPTDKIESPYNGKVLVHRGEADRDYYLDIVDRYFHGAMHLTVAELREAVETGVFPDAAPLEFTMQI